MTAIIFVGPSLPLSSRPAEPWWEWRPPVRQGELYRAALTKPAIIGIIDGYFEVTPTVWHKEILWAMSQGIHVYGAGSIGALRAAELDTFGMQGIGRVYEYFRDGSLQDDDEVAVLHGPEELGYPTITEPMVNIRATLAEAAGCGILGRDEADCLVRTAKTIFYKERTWPAVLDAAIRAGLPSARLRQFPAWIVAGRIDQKHLDAAAMLDVIRAHYGSGVEPLRVSYKLADTVAWRASCRAVN